MTGPDHTEPWSGDHPGVTPSPPVTGAPPEGSEDVTTQVPRASGGEVTPGHSPPELPGRQAYPPPPGPPPSYGPWPGGQQPYPGYLPANPAAPQQSSYPQGPPPWETQGPWGPQYGASQPEPTVRRSTKPAVLAAGVVAVLAVAAVLVLGYRKPGFFVTRHLDVANAQTLVQHVLTDPTTGYGVADVRDVTCNGGTNPIVTKGGTFTCDVSVAGAKHQVTATFTDDTGAFVVGMPK